MTDILNCPCCDGKAKFVPVIKMDRIAKVVPVGKIICKKCGLRTRTGTKGRVLKTWNRRDGMGTCTTIEIKKDGAL